MHYEKFSDGTIKCIQDDIPFKLPPRWEWCRLKSICSVLTDGTHQTPTYSDCGYVFLSSKNVTEGRIDWDNVMFIPENLHKELYTRIAPKLNDILLAKNGTTGVAAIVDKDCVFDIYVSLALIRIVSDIISPQYILNAIGSYFVQSFFKKSLKGIGVPNLHLERIRETLLPIPPYNEQIKITKTTNNLISLCEKIGSEKNSLSSLVTLAKNKILDLAIRGKLVSQDPNDEPASILLERIRKEKEELVKSGKLKRDKRESVIFRGEDNSYYEKFGDGSIQCIDEHILFEIPKSWAWVRLKNVTINRDKERKPISLRDRTKVKKIYDYYGASGIIDKIDNYIFSEKLLLIGEDGENLIARSKPLAFFADGKYWVNNHAHCIDATDKQILEFICVFINAISIEPFITGSAQPKLTQDKLNSILVPIPPEKEQSAISKKIKQLYSVLDSINFSLL